MKIISGIFAFAILVAVVCFGLSNQQGVSVGVWPLTDTVQIPLYFVGLAPLFAGLIVGGIWGWLCSVPHRFRARGLRKEIDALNNKITELQSAVAAQNPPTVSKRYFWERKA